MNRIQTRLMAVLTAMLFTTAFSANAQEKNGISFPYAFIGLQGGGQTTFTNYNNWELITPTASVSVGVHFTPVIAARVHVNGLWNKSGVCRDGVDAKFKYNYATTDLDVMVNIINLLAKKNYPLKVYLIGGVGLNCAWDNEEVPALKRYISTSDSRNRLSHNYRVGAMLDLNVARHWSVNLEVAGNSLSDRYNSKVQKGNDDWQLTAQLGVAYKIPFKKNANVSDDYYVDPTFALYKKWLDSDGIAIAPTIPEPDSITVDSTVWYDDVSVATKTVEEKIERNSYYNIRESNLAVPQVEIDAIADFVKNHKDCRVTVTGYADKGTGNPTINMKYSKQRAEKATKGLIDAGVPASIITTTAKGDTVQPFPSDNDKNRVVISVAVGKTDKTEEVKTKKSKTVKVRVPNPKK